MNFGEDLPVFGEPPVAEVALAVHIEQTESFTTAHCGAFWAEFLRDRYPLVRTHPAAPASLEGFDDEGRPSISPPMFFGFGGSDVRFWFVNEDQTRLIQMQSDRIILNWRKLDTGVYPHYDALREELVTLLDLWATFLERSVAPNVTQTEVTYVNQVPADGEIFDNISDLGKVLRSVAINWPDGIGESELLQFEQRFKVSDLDGNPGRLYITATPGVGVQSEHVLSLTLTVRGKPADQRLREAPRWLDFAHKHLIQSFAAITSDAMHAEWKEGRS